MAAHNVKKLIYSSTCATYGEPRKMPITEQTPQVIVFPFSVLCFQKFGNCFPPSMTHFSLIRWHMISASNQPIRKSQENGRRYHNWLLQNHWHGCHDPKVRTLLISPVVSLIIFPDLLDLQWPFKDSIRHWGRKADWKSWLLALILAEKKSLKLVEEFCSNPCLVLRHPSQKTSAYDFRYFNVIGSDPEGRLGEAPRPELREHGRISGACFDAARGIIPGLKVIS